MKVFISAAETSSDTHAAELLKGLREKSRAVGSGTFEVFGVGGPKLREAGLQAIVPAENLLAMGFVEVLSRLPKIRRYLNELENAARERRPDVAILCDYPDFHFKLAGRFRSLGIPVVCYIPPKIWAWRKSRIHRLAELYARVLSILPFEEKTYSGSKVAFEYVGNPLIDELPVDLSRSEARNRLGIGEDEEAILLMVGSRPSELRFHLAPMLEAARKVASARAPRSVRVLIPLPETADRDRFLASLEGHPAKSELNLRVSVGDAWVAMKAADVGIIKSGTSSLEAAILDCPHVVVYRAHPVSEWIFRHFVKYTGAISLTNLILSGGVGPAERTVKELILESFTPDRMMEEALRLIQNSEAKTSMLADFRRLRKLLVAPNAGSSPSRRAAEAVLEVASRKDSRK